MTQCSGISCFEFCVVREMKTHPVCTHIIKSSTLLSRKFRFTTTLAIKQAETSHWPSYGARKWLWHRTRDRETERKKERKKERKREREREKEVGHSGQCREMEVKKKWWGKKLKAWTGDKLWRWPLHSWLGGGGCYCGTQSTTWEANEKAWVNDHNFVKADLKST